MNKLIFFLLFVFFITSCSKNNYEKQNSNNPFEGKWKLISLTGFSSSENFNENEINWEFLSNDSLHINVNINISDFSSLPIKKDSVLPYSYDTLKILIGNFNFEYKIEANSLKLFDNLASDGILLDFERE